MTDSETLKLCDEVDEQLKTVGCTSYINAVPKLVSALRSRIKADRWIPCGERMPERGQYVLIQCKRKSHYAEGADPQRFVAVICDDGDWWSAGHHCGGVVDPNDVTHWRPLPASPEVKG